METFKGWSGSQSFSASKSCRNAVNGPACFEVVHSNDYYFGLQIIQVKPNRIGELRVADSFFNGDNMTPNVDDVLDNPKVASIVRLGPGKSRQLYVPYR